MKKKIIFMGTPEYARIILEGLLAKKDIEILAVFTQEDKKIGRGQKLAFPHIKQFIEDNNLNIKIFQPKSLKNSESFEDIKNLNPDFIIVAAYGQILPKNILEICPCINLHASLLPKYRGASPVQEAILQNEEFSGVTAMLMEEGLDCGDILGFRYVNIKGLRAFELFELLSIVARDLTLEILDNFSKILPKKQNESLSSYCKKIQKSAGMLDFLDAKECFLKFLAFNPWPGVFSKDGLKFRNLEIYEEDSSNKAGEILELKKDYMILACKRGSLKIKALQMPSKKMLDFKDFSSAFQNLEIKKDFFTQIFPSKS